MIELKNITKKIGDKAILKGISFDVKKGEVVGFLGPNGAGKTTTMKIICGIIGASSGSVSVCGIDVEKNPIEAKKKIGYSPETVPLYDDMKVGEYLRFFACARGMKKEIINESLNKAANLCGLSDKLNTLIEELSRGYKQRVCLAQAIIHSPEVLILDEPTVGLDPNQIVEIRQLIKDMGKEKTVIFSTHTLSEAKAISDRIVIIANGEIKAFGTPTEIESGYADLEEAFKEITK